MYEIWEDDPTLPKQSNYVPKSRRWAKTTSCFNLASRTIHRIVSPLHRWVESHEETWHERRLRWTKLRATRERHRKAWATMYKWQQKAKAMSHREEEDYDPLRTDTYLTAQEGLHVMPTTNAFGEGIHDNIVKFDTDSKRVGIDN